MWRLLPPLTLTLSPTLSTPSSSLYQYTIRHDYATVQRRRDAETQRRIKGGPREAQGRTKGC